MAPTALRRVARHKGLSVAIFASARKLAVLIYRMLRYGQDCVDEAYEARFERRRLSTLRVTAQQAGLRPHPAR